MSQKLTRYQQSLIRGVFEHFNERDVLYVAIRGFHPMPDGIVGSDIDVLVQPEDFDDAKSILSDHGFHDRFKSNLLSFWRGRNRDYPEWFRILRSENEGVGIDILNHFIFRSVEDYRRVRADPELEKCAFERRQFEQFFYHLHPVDEIVHLVGRGVFDKEGEFPDYYAARLDNLTEEIDTDENRQKLLKALELVFSDAADFVFKEVKGSRYQSLRDELRRYSDY